MILVWFGLLKKLEAEMQFPFKVHGEFWSIIVTINIYIYNTYVYLNTSYITYFTM